MNNLCKKTLYLSAKSVNASRSIQTNASLLENCIEVKNRNPRNLEMLTIARKPLGYHLDKPGREFWHKLILKQTGRHLHAEVHHFKNGPVIKASTQEWALKKQLYKPMNISSFANVGKVLAQRCLESGISAIYCIADSSNSIRYTAFLEEIKKSGIILEEPAAYKHANPWDISRMTKPWTIVD